MRLPLLLAASLAVAAAAAACGSSSATPDAGATPDAELGTPPPPDAHAGPPTDPVTTPFPAIGAADTGAPIVRRVGMAHQLVWGDSPDEQTKRAQQIALLTWLGVRHVRMDFTWVRLEQTAGTWDFSQLDPVVRDTAAAGIDLLALAVYGNPAYPQVSGAPTSGGTGLPLDGDPRNFYPPKDPAPYANYVQHIVTHYRPMGVRDYELWNEENIGYRFFRPKEDPAAYMKLAHAAARSGRLACPDCVFVSGGLSVSQPIPVYNAYETAAPFLTDMYTADPALGHVVNAIAYHPYQYPKDPPERETQPFPSRFQGSYATQYQRMRGVTAKHGDGDIPLWVTEEGWPTNPGIPQTDDQISQVFGLDKTLIAAGRALLGDKDFATLLETVRGVSEEQQAQYLIRTVLITMQLGIPRLYIYGLQDYDIEPLINQESRFGVFTVDGRPKMAAYALRTLLVHYGQMKWVGDLTAQLGLSDADRVVALRDGNRRMLAAWRWRGGDRTLTLTHAPADGYVRNQYGDIIQTFKAGDDVQLLLHPTVLYVVMGDDWPAGQPPPCLQQ